MISFSNEPELGVYACGHVDAGEPVLVAVHEQDASWTFLCGQGEHATDDAEPMFVHVLHLVAIDPTVDEVAAVPPGHIAQRDASGGQWRVASISRRPAARQ